jgi:hypothetical protein
MLLLRLSKGPLTLVITIPVCLLHALLAPNLAIPV